MLGAHIPEAVVMGPRNGIPATRASRGAPRGDDSTWSDESDSASGFDAHRSQQKRRQVSARALVDRLARAVRPHLVETGHRRRDAVASRRALAPVLAVAHVAVFTLVLLAVVVLALAGRVLTRVALWVLAPFGALFFRILLRGRVRLFAHPRNGLPDQLLDCPDASGVGGRNDGDRGAAASGAPGAADAMHIVVGVMRDVEVEDVADGGNVEAACGHVGGNQQRDFVLAELIERGRARRLVHVALEGPGRKAVGDERHVQRPDRAPAAGGDDGGG